MIEADVIRIVIFAPIKNVHKYQFYYLLDLPIHKDSMAARLRREIKFIIKKLVLSLFPKMFSKVYGVRRFGYISLNYEIKHLEIWDSIYPLMHLIRGGGPIFGSNYSKCHFVFTYPILEEVKVFYINRATNYGLNLTIGGETFSRKYSIATEGNAMAFGGGKDSRLVYGILTEIGCRPVIYNANPGSDGVPDLDAKRIEVLQYGITNRMMPAFMSLSRKIYIGSGLGDAHYNFPWHEYYEWAIPSVMKELSSLLSSLGVQMEFISPATVLPFNMIQKILFQRYPELYKYQYSVQPESESEKNLHISLCKLYHGIDFSNHCSEELFERLLRGFVRDGTTNPDDFGYRRSREMVRKEMRCMIYKLRDHKLFQQVKGSIPQSWGGAWIDCIHSYIYPDLDSKILDIYTQYANRIEDCSPNKEGYLPGY